MTGGASQNRESRQKTQTKELPPETKEATHASTSVRIRRRLLNAPARPPSRTRVRRQRQPVHRRRQPRPQRRRKRRRPLRPKKSWNPFNKKTAAAAATDASGASAKKSSSWNPFGKKEPNPDEIKHVKVGGGLINKFRTAEKMRTSAEKKIDAQVKAGGCAVVHNKINGQHGL
ncbi:hypothetical protein DFJ73DRAFT_768672 [Zopfochytrium polystomum]|nr:hypothetical protein DFJ73DRAFT_768672 [Zopfochytrium polystomum]